MPETQIKFEDAENFKKLLVKRTRSNDIEGQRIKQYLDSVVPDWRNMMPNRLYKHIQKMLENAEGIRRFEIDLTWKRAIYFIPLFVIFFTAFGAVFLMNEDNAFVKLVAGKVKPEAILAIISFINAFLCFCLAKINMESHKWQENWEYHVDYLQAILGLNLMRVCLRRQAWIFTIGKSNTLISVFMLVVWGMLASYFLFSLYQEHDGDTAIIWFLVLAASLFLTFLFYKCVICKCFFSPRKNVQRYEKFYIRDLEEFNFPVRNEV